MSFWFHHRIVDLFYVLFVRETVVSLGVTRSGTTHVTFGCDMRGSGIVPAYILGQPNNVSCCI